ncbi:MAG TPA: ribosome-associated translation inhibitor RaiA [Streptosporangiaceae bacterium]|nr:ribosome-associated translation inhibitor RaiA [Streptosporangiaceae bacterium]
MDVIFKGRHAEITEQFRRRAEAKLSKVEKLDRRVLWADVALSEERNPRQSGRRVRVELMVGMRGRLIRAGAAADECVAAFDCAFAKLEQRLRRLGERRKAARHALIQVGHVPSPRTAVTVDAALVTGAAVTGWDS